MNECRFDKRTKIVATLGPATSSSDLLKSLFLAGLNVARLNFSHGTYDDHRQLITNLRSAVAECPGAEVAILQDLQGPRIRIGNLLSPVDAKLGDTVYLTTDPNFSDDEIPVSYNQLHRDVRPGQVIFIADGRIQLKVHKIVDHILHCVVQVAGVIESHKGVNIPEADLQLATITEKDVHDVQFGLENGVDYVALSFVRSAADIVELRHILSAAARGSGVRQLPKIIAKIERREAVAALAEIVDVADGIMIARGDLGIEVAPERVPILQREIIDRCLVAMKPVIVATHMLDSMTTNPIPTRAEVSDVSHSVMDHTDAVMLSAETSIGAYPVETVRMMARIAKEAEESSYDDLSLLGIHTEGGSSQIATARAAVELSHRTNAKAILVVTEDGSAAQMIARFRPEIHVVAMTSSSAVARQLALVWGIVPVASHESIQDTLRHEFKVARSLSFLTNGDRVIVVSATHKQSVDLIDRVTVRQL